MGLLFPGPVGQTLLLWEQGALVATTLERETLRPAEAKGQMRMWLVSDTWRLAQLQGTSRGS